MTGTVPNHTPTAAPGRGAGAGAGQGSSTGSSTGSALVGARCIEVSRGEGGGDRVLVAGSGCWAKASAALRSWAITAPEDGSYHKTDFTVTFEDGGTYEGRYDLARDSDGDLAGHARDTAHWHAAPENAQHLDPAVAALWVELLRRYRLGD